VKNSKGKEVKMKPDRFAILGLFLLSVVVACPTTPSTNNLPPSVGISQPEPNAIVGTTATVSLNGPTDPESNPITKIEYSVDGGALVPLSSTEQGQTFKIPGLSEGSHTVSVSATDNQGKTTTPPLARTFRVDGTAPVIDPIAIDGVSVLPTPVIRLQGENVAISVTAIDKLSATDATNGGTSTMRLQLRLDGQLIKIVLGGTLTFDTKNIGLGSHTLVAEAIDAAGNIAAIRSQSLNIVEPTGQGVKPTLTLTPRTAATNGYFKGGSLVEFSWLASSSAVAVDFTLLPGSGTVAVPTSTSLSDLNTWTLPNATGNFNLKGVARDNTTPTPNMSNPVFLNVSVDNDPAVVEFTNIVSNQNFNARPINVNYIAIDALSGVRSVTLRAVAGGVSTLVGINTAATGQFVWTPSNGVYSLELTTLDNVGNQSVAVVASNVKVDVPTPDITPPTVSIDSSNIPNPAGGQIAITALASDPSGVASVTLLVEGTPVATDSAAPYIFNLDTTQYQNIQVSLQARATDLVGNVSANTFPVFTTIANARKPEFVITSPTNASTLSGLNKVTINVAKRTTDFAFTSPITVDVLDYRGKIVATRDISTAGQPATGPLSLVENTTDIDFNAFPVDAYVIRAKMTIDLAPIGAANAGDGEMLTQINVSNNNQSNQPPALQILSPQRLNETQSVLPVYVGTGGYVIADISDNTGVSSVELRMTCESGCGTSGPVNALQQYIAYIPPVTRATAILSFNANATPFLPDGDYILRVVAQDAQGNRNIQEVKARIDRTVATPAYGVNTNVFGPSAISKDEELCAGQVSYTFTGVIPMGTLFKSWLDSPSGKRTNFSQTTATTTGDLAFDEKGTWSFNSQIQETTGLRRITSVGTSIGAASRLITVPPITPCIFVKVN
jgi:large repetitive protein